MRLSVPVLLLSIFAGDVLCKMSSGEEQAEDIKEAMRILGAGDSDELREMEELEYDKSAEELPCKLLKKTSEYEIREYPRSKWVCAKDVIDLDKDPMANWRARFGGDPFKALASKEWKHHEDMEIHIHLLSYFIGANDEHKKIPMTKPWTVRVKPMAGKKAKLEGCVWAGEKYENRDMPKPKSSKVYFQRMKKLQVYVRTFDGYPLSYEDWIRETLKLRMDIKRNELGVSISHPAEINSAGSSEETKKMLLDKLGMKGHDLDRLKSSEEDLAKRRKIMMKLESDEGILERKYSLGSGEKKGLGLSIHSTEVSLGPGRPEPKNMFGVCYQSPFKKHDRKNEIWIVRIKD